MQYRIGSLSVVSSGAGRLILLRVLALLGLLRPDSDQSRLVESISKSGVGLELLHLVGDGSESNGISDFRNRDDRALKLSGFSAVLLR